LDITSVAHSLSRADISHALHSTTPGRVSFSLGGVGRNIAEGAYRLSTKQQSVSSVLVSLIGKDTFGNILQEQMKRLGMRTDGLASTNMQSSAVCNTILDSSGELVTGVADMDIIQSLDGELVSLVVKLNHSPTLISSDRRSHSEISAKTGCF
jgi:pseudouridylate synthase / pseudouridine kinase